MFRRKASHEIGEKLIAVVLLDDDVGAERTGVRLSRSMKGTRGGLAPLVSWHGSVGCWRQVSLRGSFSFLDMR